MPRSLHYLIDNALPPVFATWLREHGVSAAHVRDFDLAAADDSVILAHAIEHDQVIVSLDTDFGMLLAMRASAKPSFLLFRSSRKSPEFLLRLFLTNRDAFEPDLESGAVVVIDDARLRIRRLPVAGSSSRQSE